MKKLMVEKFNSDIIKSIPSDVVSLEIKNMYTLTKEDYDNLIVYTNINSVTVYDIMDFDYGNEIKINIEKNVVFNTKRFNKIKFNKIDGYKKQSLSVHLPFKMVFDNEYLYSEEDDFNTLVKYVSDISVLNIVFDDEVCIDKVFDIVYKLENKMLKKIGFINIITKNRTIPSIDELKLLEDDRIIRICYEDGIFDCSIDEFIVMRNSLDKIINDVISKDLSDFEKVIYVYDVVKKFKFVLSSDFYSMDGRHLHKVFSGNSIVCSGFSRIMTEVLKELNIKSCIYKLVTRDNVLHTRSLVYVYDQKYGINTIFSVEPTWESAIDDMYAYSLFLTPINKLKQWFPKEKFFGNIDVLTGEKKLNEISLQDKISLYQLFNDCDLKQEMIDNILCKSTDVHLNTFINALINVRCSQGVARNVVISNIDNIIKYNGELINYLNNKMETNIMFFGEKGCRETK